MLNPKKIESQLEGQRMTKSDLCSRVHIARSTLDSILNGADAKISTIEAIAKELHINIGFLFDEETSTEIRKAGRDYVEQGKIEHKGGEYNGVSTSRQTDSDTIQKLTDIIDEQRKRIDLLTNKLLGMS